MGMRWLAAVTLLLAGACASTANINRFKAFAELGRTYEGTVVRVIDQAAEANIDADSQRLMTSRPDLLNADGTPDAQARRRAILATNDAVLETSRALARLKTQISLLSDYFTALGALASFDGDSAIGSSMGNVVGALQALLPGLENAKIGGATPSSIASGLTTFVVSGLRSRRLTEELRRNGPIIDRHLALQEALLTLLARQIVEDQTVLANRRMIDDVIAPYGSTGALPGTWMQRRRELILQQTVAAAPAQEAVAMSRRLRLAFVALVEGGLEPGDLAALATDLGRLVTLVEQVRGAGR